LLNRSSGRGDAAAEAILVDILAEAGVTPALLESVSGDEVDAALDRLAAADLGALVVLGGDGTIRSAAERCSKANIPLVALPGGTMNMLPRALYGERQWQQALRDTLAAPRSVAVGAGDVEGHYFFCAGIFGTPAHWAEAREALRKSHFREAFRRAVNAFQRSFSLHLRYRIGSFESRTATALAVVCPLISKTMSGDAPALEVVALNTRDLGDAFALALEGLFADWRAAAQVTTIATDLLTISAKRPIPALLDGERVTLKRAAEIRFVPAAFQALVPESSPTLVASPVHQT
jgi:diacylglycerol kinase family enzyme